MKDKDIHSRTIYISIPSLIADALEKMPSGKKTAVIRELILENSARICCGELEKAAEYREKELRQRVASAFKDEFGVISKTDGVSLAVDKLAEKMKVLGEGTKDALEGERLLRDELAGLLKALRKEAVEFRKKMEKEFDAVVREQLEDYEVVE
jgi:hypothetical protein